MVGGSAPRRRKSRAPAPRKQLPTMEEPKTTVEEENGDAGAVDKMELGGNPAIERCRYGLTVVNLQTASWLRRI